MSWCVCFFLIPLFAIIIIIIIIIIMVVGWWCNAGVTRKREDPHNHLGGWWGQQQTGTKQDNKTTGACRGFGLPHALPPEHKLNKPTSTRTGLRQRNAAQHSAGRGGWRGKDAHAWLPVQRKLQLCAAPRQEPVGRREPHSGAARGTPRAWGTSFR